MNWSTPDDLRTQVQNLWDRGHLLALLVETRRLFPLRLGMKVPHSADYTARFDTVRAWAGALQQGAKSEPGRMSQAGGYRLVLRETHHDRHGPLTVPDQAWVDSLEDALDWVGKRRESQQFAAVLARTCAKQPAALPWLEGHTLQALALADVWPRLLDVVTWMLAHPHAWVYPRQVDLPGLHAGFIEMHSAVLAELYDACRQVKEGAGANGFGPTRPAKPVAQRPGLRTEPMRVRLRMLDPRQALLPTDTDQDLTVTHETFVRMKPAASRVFITDNERNLLAFPALEDSMVVLSPGPELLAQVRWLEQHHIYYWGDIDTRSFGVLDQLRAHFPQVQALLMDRETLMQHKAHWCEEPQPTLRELKRLHPEERELFDELCQKTIGNGHGHVRLEQDRVAFTRVERVLAALK